MATIRKGWRVPVWGLLASLALHAWLLAPDAALPPRESGTRQGLHARLALPAAPSPQAPSSTVSEPAAAREPPPVASVARRDTGIVGVRGPSAETATPAAGLPARRVDEAEGAPLAEGVDAEGLRRYRMEVALMARRLLRQEVGAQGGGKIVEGTGMEGVGVEGTAEERRAPGRDAGAEVGLRLAAGRAEVGLLRSSGEPMLDAMAMDLIGRAARAVILPAELRAADTAIAFPVEFAARPR